MYYGLFMGINDYPGTGSDLMGCVNDAYDMAATFGTICKSHSVLLDRAATKQGMVQAIQAVLSKLKSSDTAIISYSGHGTWLPDQNSEEPDRRDEALCPYDCDKHLLLDDELDQLLDARVVNTRVILITDSCHSGTVFRFVTGGDPPQFARRVRFLPLGNLLDSTLASEKRLNELAGLVRRAGTRALQPANNGPRAGVVHISGCKDTEYSYDASYSGRANGALTYNLLKAYATVKKKSGSNLETWFNELRKKLPSRDYPQTPILNAFKAGRKWPIPK